MIEYKIKEHNEDPKESIIEKTGGTVEFSINGIDKDIIYLEKQKKELIAQKGLEEAKKANVLGTHPHIEQMSEEDRVACYLYQQSFAFCKVANSKIKEIDDQINEYTWEKEEIIKQTGLKIEEKIETPVAETNG